MIQIVKPSTLEDYEWDPKTECGRLEYANAGEPIMVDQPLSKHLPTNLVASYYANLMVWLRAERGVRKAGG